ncbi:MAG: hypothetical protein WCA35_17820, partial [Kovacikia sp.]
PTADYVSGFQVFHGTRDSKQLEVVHLERAALTAVKDGRLVVVSRLIHRFVTWLETGVPGAPSFQHGLRVQHLLEAARESHKSGCWVNCLIPPGTP